MKPLIGTVVAFCLIFSSSVLSENAKELTGKSAPILEDAEESDPQVRAERCTTCGGNLNLAFKSPNQVLAAIQALPGSEVHTQSSYEGCSSEKGCAGIKVKDGRIIERFGNFDAFRAAAAADTANEFNFHSSAVLQGGIPKDGPFWWMNENSPFKAAASGSSGGYEKFSKSSSSSFSNGGGISGAGGSGGNGASFGAPIDLSGNPFLNGDFSKLSSGFAAGNAGNSAGGSQFAQESSFAAKPASSYSSYESSSFSSSSKGGEIDISKNPFLNGGFKNQAGQAGQAAFQGQASFGASAPGSQGYSASSGNKFSSSGYTGSSPSPFTASTAGSNVNLIQNSQKASEFDYESQQQNQQNIDEIFQETGNVHAHEHSGVELQQTCAGQGYVCVHKAQCNNGVVNTNGAGILQAKTKKQYCNTKTEICCRIEISTLQGAGGLQGSLGVGSATFSGSNQGGGLFVSTGQAGASGFDASGSNQRENSFNAQGQSAQGGQGAQGSQGSYGSTQSSFESSSSSFGGGNRGSFGINGQGATGQGNGQGVIGNGQAGINGFTAQGSSSFGSNNQGSFGSQGGFNQGAVGQGGVSQGGVNQGATGFGSSNGGNRGVTTFESSSSSFETRGNNFGANGNANGIASGNNGFSATGTRFGAGTTGSGFNANGFASTGSGSFGNTNKFGQSGFNNNANDVTKTVTQTSFKETDSFSAGSEANGFYRPGASGAGLKPGVPYLPPVDNSNSGSSVISSTAFASTPIPTTPRPIYTTPRPTYLPPSTSAPGYLPPEGEQTINTETRVPKPVDTEGELILDTNRFPNRPKKPVSVPQNVDVPAGCAAALKCTPIEFCTAEGVMSNTSVILTRDQESYRVPLTDCKDIESGFIGKCCRDPNYSDPWPTNLIGKWAPGVFGGNDGKYTPDSRVSSNNIRPAITARPPVTGSVLLNNFRTPKPTLPPYGPNQVTPGYGTTVSQGAYTQKQFDTRGQGQYTQGGQGQYAQAGQGQFAQGAQGQFAQGGQASSGSQYTQTSFNQNQFSQGSKGQRGQGQLVSQGQGQLVSQGQGQFALGNRGQYSTGGQGQIEIQEQSGQSQFSSVQGQRGQGQLVSQGQGQLVSQGQGQLVSQGQGQLVSQGQGQLVSQGQGQLVSQGQGAYVNRGQGQIVSQGQGFAVSQGQGQGIRQGQGFAVSQGQGFAVENDYSETVQRVFLDRYSSGVNQCGLLQGTKPYGNRNDLEVDFAEIPWQAMVLLQTNKSLLCGGVITRPDVVITTASCVEGLQAKNVLIKGGEWKLGIDDEPLPFQIVQVKNILRHPYYKAGGFHYDAAILVLTENLRLAKNIFPICLPRSSQETLDAFYNGAGECIVTGWGKQVLQAHLAGSILHSLNVSLINPGECQAKISQDYPHLLEQYDQESCACGQPTNPINNICRVDTGSALACSMGDGHFFLRGIYSWDSGCQPGNQLAAFYKFDLEWYEWAIGLIESARFAQFGGSAQSQSTSSRFSGQINSGIKGNQYSGGQINSGLKGNQYTGFKGASAVASVVSGVGGINSGLKGQFGGQVSQGGQYSQFSSSKFAESSNSGASGINFQAQIKPIQNSFSASYSEKKVFQSEPKIITFTTKPEIITYTTKPEIFTYTTKPKIVTYTTKPQIIRYETSGSGQNPQYVSPGVTYNPSFSAVVGKHTHNAQCKCLEQ